MRKIITLFVLAILLAVDSYAQKLDKNIESGHLPVPVIPAKLPPDSVSLGDSKSFPEVQLGIPIARGPL